MEKLTNYERYWLLGELQYLVDQGKKAASLFAGEGSDAVAQSAARDSETAQSILRKLRG